MGSGTTVKSARPRRVLPVQGPFQRWDSRLYRRSQVLDDPDVHGDRFCGPSTVTVDQEGWYDLRVRYFQRKGSAALSLQWQPRAGRIYPVPAEPTAFAAGRIHKNLGDAIRLHIPSNTFGVLIAMVSISLSLNRPGEALSDTPPSPQRDGYFSPCRSRSPERWIRCPQS